MESFEKIVADTLHIPEADVRDDLTAKDIPDWDSLNYLFLIAALEKEFSVSFPMETIIRAKTLGEIRALTEARGK